MFLRNVLMFLLSAKINRPIPVDFSLQKKRTLSSSFPVLLKMTLDQTTITRLLTKRSSFLLVISISFFISSGILSANCVYVLRVYATRSRTLILPPCYSIPINPYYVSLVLFIFTKQKLNLGQSIFAVFLFFIAQHSRLQS